MSVILLIVFLSDRRAIDVREVDGDLAGGQSFGRQGQHDLVDPRSRCAAAS